MGVEWQSRDFLTDWTGLFNRLQYVDVPPSYARTCRNVDFFGSALGKRQGTQLVNGWSTVVTGPWTQVGLNASGPVADASGFRTPSVETLQFTTTPTGGTATALLQAVAAGNVLQCTNFSGTLPTVGTVVYATRPLGTTIDGLYHAVFRDGTEQLLAAAAGTIWNVWGTAVNGGVSYVPVALTRKLPTVSVAFANWLALNQGQISNPETLVAAGDPHYDPVTNPTYPPGATYADVAAQNPSAAAPDIIQIIDHVFGTVIYEGTIKGFDHADTNTIILSANAAHAPVIGDQVVLFPSPHASDTRFTMLNNRVYVSFAGAANPVSSGPAAQATQRQPPVVIEQPQDPVTNQPNGPPYIRRMGIRAPTSPPLATPAGSGEPNSGTRYRFTYLNSLNGQESEASPESQATIVGPGPNDVPPAGPVSVSVHVYNSPDPQVDKINIYRTLAGPQDGSWYYVATIPNSGVTTYTDLKPDDQLGQLLKTFVNEPPPDSVTYLAVWTGAGTLIGIDSGAIEAGGETVCWGDAPDIVSGVYKLESWPINNTVFVNRDDGDKLVTLGVFYDSVVVWKGRSMHRIVGVPPDIILQPISFRDDHTGVGIWSAKGFIMDTDVALFVSDDGFYQVSRYEGVQQGFTSSRISRAIDQEFLFRTAQGVSAQRHVREISHLLYHRTRRRLQAFIPVDTSARPTDMFVYQLEGTVDGTPHGWSLWSVPPSGQLGASYVSASCMVNFMMAPDRPHYGVGPTGLVVMGDVGAGEWQGFPVTIDYETVWFSPSGAGTVARARAVDFVFVPQAGTPVPHLLVGTDFDTPSDEYQLPALTNLGASGNVNPLILALGQYYSIGFTETSVTGLFLVQDFTFWFQRLPVGVTPRIIPVPLSPGLP